MKIFIGADHNGFALRNNIKDYLVRAGYDVSNVDNATLNPEDDYPLQAIKLVHELQLNNDEDSRGILICGSGQGMCMAANRFKGIRALLGYDRQSIVSARHDDDANVLCLPANTIQKEDAFMLVETFLNTKFSHIGRHQRRIKELDEL